VRACGQPALWGGVGSAERRAVGQGQGGSRPAAELVKGVGRVLGASRTGMLLGNGNVMQL
jgi:hypothetical protein